MRGFSLLLALVACQASTRTTPPPAPLDGKPGAGEPTPSTPAADDPPDPDGATTAEAPSPAPPRARASDSSPAGATEQLAAPPGAGPLCDDGKHKVGERWKVDCNDCWCTDNGEVACTRKGCGPH